MHLLRALHQKLDSNKNESSVSVRPSTSTDASMISQEKRQSQRQYAHVMIPVEIVQENNNSSSHNAADMCFGSCCRK